MTTRHRYQDALEELQLTVLRMGGLVEEAIGKATYAFSRRDVEMANGVIKGDLAIDALEREIAERCTTLIATEQPVAGDLRLIVSTISIGNELERIGDYAVHLARVATRLSPSIAMKARTEIPHMAEITINMIRDSLQAFLQQDLAKAEEVQKRDDLVDGIYAQLFKELLEDMYRHRDHIPESASLLFVSKYLERLADHITNICKEVSFICTGRRPGDSP